MIHPSLQKSVNLPPDLSDPNLAVVVYWATSTYTYATPPGTTGDTIRVWVNKVMLTISHDFVFDPIRNCIHFEKGVFDLNLDDEIIITSTNPQQHRLDELIVLSRKIDDETEWDDAYLHQLAVESEGHVFKVEDIFRRHPKNWPSLAFVPDGVKKVKLTRCTVEPIGLVGKFIWVAEGVNQLG